MSLSGERMFSGGEADTVANVLLRKLLKKRKIDRKTEGRLRLEGSLLPGTPDAYFNL